MARRRKTKGKKRQTLDPEAVLAGRVEVRPEELFDLVHRVNPTGRELNPGAEARRYQQKARLQSLLVRRFGDDHVVVKPGGEDGVVSLVHRSGVKDACHAVVAELDPDARSWIRNRLDLESLPAIPDDGIRDRGAAPGRPRPCRHAEEETASTGELLGLARRALDEFDYEAAERRLRLAFERSRGGVEAAVELLELLVGVLGMDPQALEIEPRLSPPAAAHPGVRTFLALAAARCGETERALGLVKGTELPRTAEVYAALTAAEVRRRDPEAAGRYLDRAERHDPTLPQIPGLAREIAELRGELQRPVEEKLEGWLAAEGPLAVEDEARALLARWPESEVARHILRQVADHRRRVEIAEHLELAERAWEDERFRDAAHHYQAALEAGSDQEDLPALVEEARERERRQREEAEVAEVVRRFAGGDERGALLAYLALSERLRHRVQQRNRRPALAWLEEIDPPSSGARALAAVTAVLALGGAVESLGRGDARSAVEVLSPHAEILSGVGEAGRCLREARSRVARERRERGRQALEEARDACDAGRIVEAQKILEGLDAGDLASADRSRSERLQARLRRLEMTALLDREYRQHLDAEDLLGALDRARRLAAETEDPADGQRWARRGDRLRRRIRAAWSVDTAPGPLPLDELRDFDLPSTSETPEIWLDDEGRELVLADVWQRWLFVRVVDLETATVTSLVSLRTPEPMGRFLHTVCVDGDRLRIFGEHGHLLELARDRWQILRWRSVYEVLPRKAILDQAVLVPRTPYLWLAFRTSPYGASTGRILDLRSWRVCRRISDDWAEPILGPAEPWVITSNFEEGAHLREARGTPGQELRLPPAFRILAAALRPEGRTPAGTVSGTAAPGERPDQTGLWLMGVCEDIDEDQERVELLELMPAADALEIRSRLRISNAFEDSAHPIAIDVGSGLGFVLVSTTGHLPDLLAVAASPDGVRQRYRVPVAEGTVLVQDRRARRAVALNLEAGPLKILALGPERPPADALGTVTAARRDRHLPALHPPFYCDPATGTMGTLVAGIARELRVRDREAYVKSFERDHGDHQEMMIGLAMALQRVDREGPAWSSLARRLAEQHPQDAGAALLVAEHGAATGDWQQVAQRLEAVDPGKLDDDRGRHCHHLLGIALLHLEQPDEAAAVFRQAPPAEDGCDLASLIVLAQSMAESPAAGGWGPDQPLVRQLVEAIRTADPALEAGDLETAREALDCRAIWQASEVQSAARLAELYLRIPDEGLPTAERFRKRLALAFFCELQTGDRVLMRRELDLPGLAWEKARLEEIADRARAWLDGD